MKVDAAAEPTERTSGLRSFRDEKSVQVADVLNANSGCQADTALPFACAEMALHLDCKDIRHVPVDLIYERRNTFPRFLERRKFDRSTRLMYLKSLKNLFRQAQRFGWQPDLNLSQAWESLLPIAKSNGVADLLRYFAARRIEPSELTRAQINDWIDQRVIKRERTFWSAWEIGSHFLNMLISQGFSNVDPVAFARREYYRVKFTDLKETLQKEVNDLVNYLTSASVNGGSDEPVADSEDSWEDREDEIEDPNLAPRRQIRDVTAKGLRATICRMCGFIKTTEDRQISELRELYNRRVFWGFKNWLIETRVIEPWALRHVFSGLVAAALQYPKLASNRIWLRNFLAQIPIEPESDRRKRIASRNCLSHQELRTIPGEIRKERIQKQALAESLLGQRERKQAESEIYQLVLKEFLMRWILVLPWRARNLCECRISGDFKNLLCEKPLPYSTLRDSTDFKEQLDKMATSDSENMKQQRRSPRSPGAIDDAKIWYYAFSKEECKGKTPIERVVPAVLIDALNEYLSFRTSLDAAHGVENLLVNSKGEKLTTHTLYCMLCEITLQWGGRRISTKTFRDIFAFEYLKTHREYSALEDLSRILWHTNTITTRRYYATKFDLSALTDCVETYLNRRGSPVGKTTDYGLTLAAVTILAVLFIPMLIRGCEAYLSNVRAIVHH